MMWIQLWVKCIFIWFYLFYLIRVLTYILVYLRQRTMLGNSSCIFTQQMFQAPLYSIAEKSVVFIFFSYSTDPEYKERTSWKCFETDKNHIFMKSLGSHKFKSVKRAILEEGFSEPKVFVTLTSYPQSCGKLWGVRGEAVWEWTSCQLRASRIHSSYKFKRLLWVHEGFTS